MDEYNISKEQIMKIIDGLFQKYAKNEEVFLKTEEVNELIKDCFSKVGKYG